MLADPRFRNPRSLGNIGQILNLIDQRNVGVTRVQQGVYECGHWNFNDLIDDVVFDHPEFHQGDLDFIRSKDKNNLYYNEKERDAADRAPAELEGFYRRENWKEKKNQYEIYLGAYGVCDSPEQLLSLYDFESDPRRFCISLVRLNRKEQDPEGGWRWHKWGEYVGLQEPTTEYLYDEPVIEMVYTYHIYELL